MYAENYFLFTVCLCQNSPILLSPFICSVRRLCACMCVFEPGDAVWHAGGRPAGLAEEHGVSTLHKEQQTDHLVLAGTVTHKHTHTAWSWIHYPLLIMEGSRDSTYSTMCFTLLTCHII